MDRRRLLWFLLLLLLSLGGCGPSQPELQVVDRDGDLLLLSNATVVDRGRRLMWAASDTKKQLSFEEAEEALARFRLAGYRDWRFPTQQELESLVVVGAGNPAPPGPACFGG